MVKKSLLIGISLSLVMLSGCKKELDVKINDKVSVEYGTEIQNKTLYDDKKSDKNVKVKKSRTI